MRCIRLPFALACAAALSMGSVTTTLAQGINVAITQSNEVVAPGSEFTLTLEITSGGSAFNGFDAVVSFDPAALTFVPTSPTSLQQGPYMVQACGNTFHLFSSFVDSLKITDVLLCSGVALPGPGQLYSLKFIASNTPQVTQVQLHHVRFFEAGLEVTPVFSTGAVVYIGSAVGVEPSPDGVVGIQMSAQPNPFRGLTSITITSSTDGEQRVVVRDIQGRAVRNFGQGWYAAGTRHVQWDGRDDAGRPLPPGVYRLTLLAGRSVVTATTALLR